MIYFNKLLFVKIPYFTKTKMSLINRIFPILLIILLFHSCSIFEPPAQIPAFIHIDSIGLKVDSLTQGTASHKIVDAWVYVDQNLVGVYELPSTIAVLASGVHEVDIKAGILVDGIKATREAYPFYTFYSQNVNLSPQQVTKINPVVTYYSGIPFTWIEDFEKPGITMQTVSSSYDTLIKTATNVFEGIYSAYVGLSSVANKNYFEYNTSNIYILPTDGSHSVFLEMNYMGTNSIRVGVLPIASPNNTAFSDDTVLNINPSSKWNKIYVDLTSVCGSYPTAFGFKIFIAAALDPGLNNSEIYFDNLKLICQH